MNHQSLPVHGLGERQERKHGFEYVNVPSLLARRALHHVLTLGEDTCPPGFRFSHPNPRSGFVDDRGVILHFIRSGQLTHRIHGKEFTVTRGQAALLELRRPVEYFNPRPGPVRLWWVWFEGIGLTEVLAEMGVERNPVFTGFDARALNDLYRRLSLTVQRQPAGHEIEAAALLTAMLANLARTRPPGRTLGSGSVPRVLSPEIRKAVEWIARWYPRRWAIKELSLHVGISPSHFFRKFLRETGYTPIQYINRYRIEQARVLLTSTRLPVEEIARQVGIPNRKHFAKVFHKVTRQSPREFRAKPT